MKYADKVALRRSAHEAEMAKLRTELGELLSKSDPTAEDEELAAALNTKLAEGAKKTERLEADYQAAVKLDEADEAAAAAALADKRPADKKPTDKPADEPATHTLADAETREYIALSERVEVGRYLLPMLQERGHQVDGRERELREAIGLTDYDIPWEAVVDRSEPILQRRTEDGNLVDASVNAPTTIANYQKRILQRVFEDSLTVYLGCEMDMLPLGSGDALYYVITAGATAEFADRESVVDADAATLTPTTLSPRALECAYLIAREDIARVRNLESRLRADLRGAFQRALDNAIINGDANFGGLLQSLTDPADPTNVLTHATGAQLFSGQVDGLHAYTEMQVRSAVGTATYNLMTGLFQSSGGDSLAAYLRRVTGGIRATNFIAAPASDIQQAIVCRTRPTDGPNMVCPMWGGITFNRDSMSRGVSRARYVSLQFDGFYDAAVLRTAAYEQVAAKVA